MRNWCRIAPGTAAGRWPAPRDRTSPGSSTSPSSPAGRSATAGWSGPRRSPSGWTGTGWMPRSSLLQQEKIFSQMTSANTAGARSSGMVVGTGAESNMTSDGGGKSIPAARSSGGTSRASVAAPPLPPAALPPVPLLPPVVALPPLPPVVALPPVPPLTPGSESESQALAAEGCDGQPHAQGTNHAVSSRTVEGATRGNGRRGAVAEGVFIARRPRTVESGDFNAAFGSFPPGARVALLISFAGPADHVSRRGAVGFADGTPSREGLGTL